MHGHYGVPATRAAFAIGIALIGHILLPFAVVEFRGPAPPEPQVVRFFEASDILQSAPQALTPLSWSPGLIFAGLAIAALGAAILMVLGHQPLEVHAARWIGASGGLLIVAGAATAGTSALYHVGTGFSTFLGTLLQTEFRAQTWAVSTVVTAVAMLVAAYYALDVMVKVSANRDGIRDTANSHAQAAKAGFALLAVILLVPWAIGLLPEGLSDRMGIDAGSPDAPLFFSAQDVQGATLSELDPDGRLRFATSEDWALTKLGITIMASAAWVTIGIGALGTFMGTARSTGAPRSTDGIARFLLYPTTLLWIAAVGMWFVTWFTAAPRDIEATFLPGFFPIAIPVVAFYAIREHLRLMIVREAAVIVT